MLESHSEPSTAKVTGKTLGSHPRAMDDPPEVSPPVTANQEHGDDDPDAPSPLST